MRYIIIQGTDLEWLVANVESFLKQQGRQQWEPRGRPFEFKENGAIWWAQAMWRVGTSPKEYKK